MALLYLRDILDALRESLNEEEGAVAAYLFGSYARGDFHEESDVDVLVVTKTPKKTEKALQELSWDIQLRFGVVVSFVVVPLERWERGLTPLREVVEREGRLIWRRGGK